MIERGGLKVPAVAQCDWRYLWSAGLTSRSAQWVKDPVLQQLWHRSQLKLRSDLWPRNCHMPGGSQKRKKRKRGIRDRKMKNGSRVSEEERRLERERGKEMHVIWASIPVFSSALDVASGDLHACVAFLCGHSYNQYLPSTEGLIKALPWWSHIVFRTDSLMWKLL